MISATGISTKHIRFPNSACSLPRGAGFTLLELIAVVTIVGIILSIAVLYVDRDEVADKMDEEARRLQQLLGMAREEAILQNQQIAVAFSEHQYSFERFTGADWELLVDDPLFRPRGIGTLLRMSLVLDGEVIEFAADEQSGQDDDDKEDADDEEAPPRIFILSSGEISPFELTFTDEDRRHSLTLRGEFNGVVRISERRSTL